MPTAEMPWTIVFLVSRLLGITRHAFCCLTDGWLSWLKRDRLGADTRYGSIKLVSSWSIFQLTFSFLPQNHSHERTNPLIENVLYRLDWMERHEKKRERWGERTRPIRILLIQTSPKQILWSCVLRLSWAPSWEVYKVGRPIHLIKHIVVVYTFGATAVSHTHEIRADLCRILWPIDQLRLRALYVKGDQAMATFDEYGTATLRETYGYEWRMWTLLARGQEAGALPSSTIVILILPGPKLH
jgi:hypothetical protein